MVSLKPDAVVYTGTSFKDNVVPLMGMESKIGDGDWATDVYVNYTPYDLPCLVSSCLL